MSTAALADTERLEKLDRAIEAMVRSFEKLLHASKMQANADGSVGPAGSTKAAAEERVPGQFLEVLAEKMVSQCNEAIVQIRALKHTALLSDFKLQNRALKETHTRMGEATRQTSHQIRHLKREILQMLQLLEGSYYSGSVRSEGTDEDHGIDASLRELYHLAVSAAPTE